MFGTTVATQLSTVTLRGMWWNCLTETSNFIMSPSRYSAAGRTNCQSSERHRTKMCRFDEKHEEQGVGYWRTVTRIFTTGTVRKWLLSLWSWTATGHECEGEVETFLWNLSEIERIPGRRQQLAAHIMLPAKEKTLQYVTLFKKGSDIKITETWRCSLEVYKIWPLVVTLDVDCDVSGSDDLTVPQRTGIVHQCEWVDERVLIHLKHSLLETLSFSHK